MAYDPELLTQDFIPFDDVVKTPTYEEGDNDTRVSKFDNWSSYSLDYHKKKLAEAPDEEKPLRQKELDTQTSLINEKKEAVYNKYDLKYQVSKMGAGELIAALRDPNKLLEEGHKPELIQGLRAEVEKEFAPILAQSQAGTLSENEAAKALWEEPNFGDKVANFANQVLPMAAIMAAKAVEGGANLLRKPVLPANEVKDWDTFGKNMGNVLLENVAGAAKGVSEWVGKEAPLDPRFSADTSAFISGAAQMPGNLALGLAGAPVNATSNYLQMFQENLDAYEPEISKARYDAEVESGKTSASTPFKQWQSLLSKDDKEDIRAEAATKAMVVAMPQAALETVSDALLLKHIPLPAAIKKKLPSFLRNAAPKTFIGGKIVGQFLAKTGIEGGTEGAQTVMKNVGSAINTGDWSGENLTEGVRESFIGGVAGGGVATALRIPNTFRTEKALDWALGVSTGRLDSDAQKDIAILRNPEIDKSSPEYQEADSRFSTRNNTDRQHQFDLATIASPTEDQSPSEIKAAKARVSAREDEAHWVLSKLESEDADPIRAQRYQAKTAAQKDFQDSIAQHLQKSAVDWDPSGEKLRARAQEIEDSFSKVEANAKAIGSNLDVAAAKKMALDQLLGTQDKQAQAAEDSLLDALGSSDSAGPLRAKFARQELMRLYPEQNAHLTPWFKDDSTVVEMLNARENEEIDDDTNLDSWLASPEGIKSTTSDKKTDTATEEKPKGLMTVGQRRDAFRLAEDNAEASGDENQKKEFARLKEDVDFWHSVLSDTESNEQDKAEAKAKLPALEGSLLDLATAPVEEKSLNQAANDQNQPPSQASVSNQEVSPTSPESSRTGEGTPFTVVRTMDGGETTQTEQDYINESREIVKSLTGRGEIKMTPEAALQNVEAVRQEIESAPDLTPEQKQQWSSHFDNIPLVVQQLNPTGTTLPTSEPVSETTAGAPIPIAQPTPVRMGGVTGDLTRTESGEAVFSPTDNSPETVLRVKETSIEKDPATLTVEDFESGDGTPLVSETDKQFSVLPQNERLVRPFFRSEPAPLSPAEQPKRGETQNEIQQTESLREGQSQPLRQGQSSSSAEGQSSSLQGQEITYQTTAQDGQMAKSSGSYPEDAGSTPAPATPAPTRTRADVESSPEGVAIVKKYDRHYEMVSDFDLNLGDATRAQAVALTNKLLKAGAITESDAAEALRLAKDKGYDREDAVSEAASVLQGAVEFRKDQQIDELLATPVAEAATPPSSSAIDTATITADVQANPDAHRRIQGRKREVSREGAVAILTQLPESFTKQDAINIAKDAGMSRERLTKLATLRNDPNSVSSIMNGAMDAELGLFDRNAEPTEDAAVPPAIPETNAEVSKKDTTKPAVTPNQSPADRWVYTGVAAFEEKLRGLKGSKYDQLRAALDSDTGRADLQRKLAGVFNIKVQKTLKAGGVLDPVVLEDTTEKILYGNVNQNDSTSLTENVMGDLISNLEQTGDPFRVGSGVAYDASGRVRNQGKPARKTQSRRDRGLVSESTDGDGNVVNPKSETPTTVTMQGTTDTAPERAANKEEAQKRVHQAVQDSFSEVVQSLSEETGDSIYDTTLAVSKLLQDKYGIDVADPVALGWKSPDSNGRVKQKVLNKLAPRSGEIFNSLKATLDKNVKETMRQNKADGLLESPVVSADLASIIQANIYESLISEDKFKPAIQKAREQKSTAPLMPVLAEIGRNDVANIQSVVQNVLNNGKPFASHRDITSLTQSDMQAVLDSGMLPERVQETLQALVDLNGDGMALLRNSTNEGWRRWSEILGEQIGNRAPVQVMFNLALDPSVTGQGLWKEGTNKVHISPFLTREPGLMESTMLHEMMHPIWDWKVTAFQRGDQSQLNQKEIAALTELSGLFDLVNKEAQSRLSTITDPAALSKAQRDLLGASNLREFLNEAINHKPFQDFLAELKDPDAKGKGGLLRRIVNAILRLIRGGEVAADSILQRSFELSLDLANYTDRELPIAERNKTQIDYFKSLEAERGRPLTLPEYERASVDFALKYPQPRIANTPAEASRLAQETLVPDELDAFNEYQRTKNEPVLASEMVTEAQEIYDAIKANGGITVDVWDGSRPSSGIVVAPFKETETTFSLNEFTASDVKDYMEKFRPLLEVSGMHLGGWVDNDTVYLDVSIVADNEVTATALAQDGNQLATFNLENFTQLNTPDLLAKYGGESGEVSRLRSETRYKDLRGALEQALRRAMGGVQRTDSPNVSGQGAVQERTSPELDLVETLTGETPTAEEAAKILESSPVPTYYDNLTNKGTDPITGIRTAIGRAAKRGNGAGRNAAQGNEGPLVRGSDFPDEIRRGDRETHQELERAWSGINEALGGSLPFQSLELIKQLTGQANAPEGSELAQTIDALRNKIPVLPNNALEGLKQLSEGMSSKVFVDTKNDSAYKLLSVSETGSVGGTFPKNIRIRAADDTVVIASEKNPSLLEFLRAVAISNVQGNAVFTEIAGVTEDGDVILKQPYIKGLTPTDNFDNPEDFREALRDLGLSMLSDIGAVSAVGKVGTRYALFDDLHGENVMRDKNGRAQLVDALATRLLSADEYTSVSPYLKDPEVLQSVAVSYEKAKGERLETLLDKAVPEAPQTPFLPVSEFEQAKASLATLVLGPNSSIKGRSGIVVNFQSPDYSTAGFLLNPERVRGQRPIEPTKQEALEARVTHALTDDFDRATPNANKVASAPMIVQTLKQADFVASQDPNGKFPVTTFVKLYNDPSSPSGIRWHFVETLDGRFSTQYSSSDRVPDKGRALGLKVVRIGDSAPKTPNVAPAVIQEEAPEPMDIEAEQTRILEELDALAQKRDRLLRDQNYKAAGEVYDQIRELEDKFDSSSVAASAPVTPAQALPTGFKQTTATAKDRRETTALSRVMIDPEYQGVRDALEGKQYISYDANETTAKANEFLNSPDFNGNLEAAVLSAGSRLPIEQIVMVKGLAIQRAQKAANAARATMLDPSLPIQVRNNASVISTQYQKISDRITDDLMEMGSLAGQELRAFRLLADALVPRTWVKKYKQPIIKAQREKLTNDPVFKDMMARIAIAQKNAANSTNTRMQKALAMAAAKFVKDTSVEEVTAYEDFARAMASGMPVKDDVMKAAIEMVVVSGMETVKKSVAPNEQVDPSFLKQWEDKLRSIASEQLNGIIESRLQGGKVDAEAQADLTEEQKAEAYEQKIMDAWRDFSDFPLAEMVFNLARTTIVASDSPYASLVQKAQFDPAKIKRLQQAVKLSINTKDEIRKSLGDKNMSVESLKLRLQEANPNLTENELGALANAVQEVYNSEVQRASVAALQGIIKAGNRETRKIIDAPMIAKLLPLVNMGAFQDEAVYNALADKFNLPTWTQESADKIEALANGVQALPEGSIQRGEAGQQMLLEILQENIKDSRGGKRVQHYSQIAAALWTAGVLSGPSTQIVNAAGTTASVFLESLSEATGHFIEAKKRGVSTGQATEYYKDIARAWLFAFGKDANNVSLRAMNEVHTGLTRGTTKFKSEKQEDLSLLELFKFDPRAAIPGNTLMEAITTGQWKAVVPALGDLGLGVAKTMAERVVTGDVKGALRDYVATRKMVGRLMLASDATNSFSASTIKQMMLKRTLMQKAGLSESEVNRQMKEIQKGGDATIVNAAKAQAEQEAAEGQFGQSGSAQNISKARRVEQLIEQMTYGNEVIEGGRNYAGEITFNGEPSGLIGLVMMETFGNLNKHLGLVAKPINPFPKTISNLLNNSLNYTIYGSFRAYGKNFGSFLPESNEYRKVAPERGSAEFYALQTKAAAGTIALATFAMMLASAFKDRREKKEPFFELHGPGPKDPKMRAQWVGAGHKPFSMRIGEVELRFTDWPGINIPLGMLGTIYDNAVYGDREADLLDQLFTGLAAVMGTTLDRNMLGGASAVFDILSKNTYDGAKQAALGKFASSYVGGFLKPSDIRYFETIATGGYQDTRSLSGWFKSQIPFVGAINGNPALNVLGESIEVSAWDATAGRLVSLSNTHPILSPLTTAELLIPEPKAYKISDPSSPTRVRPMEAQELYDFTKIYGEAMRNRLTPEMVDGLVEQAKTAPQGAQDRLTKIAESVRNQAQGELMRARDIRKGKENKGP